jgi:hypothetical protein
MSVQQKLEGFTWATALDLSMGYYHIVLDKESSYLCTMIVPWGKYRYCRLPMGLNGSPDIFQAIINDIMGDLPNVRAYLDDILITTAGSYEDHLKHVELVLQRLSDVGFAINLRKSSFAVTEIDYLGYWITRRGIQPQPKKVEAIMRLTPPTTKRQLRRFLGMINYYRDMWRRRSHILAPLTTMCSAKAKFVWHDKEQKAFEEIKAIISRETLLAYPDFSKDFHIYTDSSDYQLGAVIMQNDHPLAFYYLRPENKCSFSFFSRENSGILPKRHGIRIPCNEHYSLMYNIISKPSSLNNQKSVFISCILTIFSFH